MGTDADTTILVLESKVTIVRGEAWGGVVSFQIASDVRPLQLDFSGEVPPT